MSHALIKKMISRVFDFYGAEVDTWALSMWAESLESERIELIEKALKQYMKTSVFAPKPAQIIGLIAELKDMQRRNASIAYVKPEEQPLPSNDHLMDLMERTMDAASFKHYRELAFYVLGKVPKGLLAPLQWKLMWYAVQIKLGHMNMSTAQSRLKN